MNALFAVSIYWHLPILLITFSLVYSATRHDRWDRILAEAAGWVMRITSFLGMIGVGLYVFSTYPDYWPYLVGVGGVLFGFYWWLTTHKKEPATR